MFRDKFWGTLLLSVPTIMWAPMIQHWFGYEAPGGPATSRWIPAIFGTLVFAYGGLVFIKGAISELRDREGCKKWIAPVGQPHPEPKPENA